MLGLVADPTGDQPLVVDKVPSPRGAEAVVEGLVDLAAELIEQAETASEGKVVAVGLGAPGLVDRSGTLRYGPNIPGVKDFAFAAVLG